MPKKSKELKPMTNDEIISYITEHGFELKDHCYIKETETIRINLSVGDIVSIVRFDDDRGYSSLKINSIKFPVLKKWISCRKPASRGYNKRSTKRTISVDEAWDALNKMY